MKGSEFIKKIRKHGRSNGVSVVIEKNRGKGSHITLIYGDQRTIVKDRTKEIGTGLYKAMIKQLGIDDID